MKTIACTYWQRAEFREADTNFGYTPPVDEGERSKEDEADPPCENCEVCTESEVP